MDFLLVVASLATLVGIVAGIYTFIALQFDWVYVLVTGVVLLGIALLLDFSIASGIIALLCYSAGIVIGYKVLTNFEGV